MKFRCLFAVAVLMVSVGCSTGLVTADGTDPGADLSMRLIGTNGQFRPLSDPAADDLAPQIVTVGMMSGTNDLPVPTRFLYFVSDRSNGNPDLPVYSVYRAQELSPGVFTNLEAVAGIYGVDRVLNMTVLPVAPGEPGSPGLVLSVQSGGVDLIRFLTASQSSFYEDSTYLWPAEWPLTNVYPGGVAWLEDGSLGASQPETGRYMLCVYGTNFAPQGAGVTAGFSMGVDGINPVQNFVSDLTNTFPLLKLTPPSAWPLSALLASRLRYTGSIAGIWPFCFPQPGNPGRKVFGLVAGIGGRLVLAFNTLNSSAGDWLRQAAPPGEYATHPYFRADGAMPLWMIEHPPGCRDVAPSVDPRTGIYFSSDRGGSGKFDMYYVPLRSVFETAATNDPATGL